jgi:branched-chain amino acid transport system substrate-binding protein
MKRTNSMLTALVLACVLTPACKSDPVSGPSEPIEVGTLSSVSGDLASLGVDFNDATTLAIAEINDSGGVLDRKLKLVVEDDGTSPDGAKEGYVKLLARQVPVVLGPTTSGQVEAIIDLIASGNTVTIARTTTADRLSELADNGYFFRLVPADQHQTQLLASLVIDSGVEHLCLVHRRDIYGNNLATGVQQKLAASGKPINIIVSDYNPSASNLSGIIGKCDALVCKPGATNDGGVDSGDGGDGGTGGGGCTAPPPSKVGLMLITYIEDGALILDDAQTSGWSAKAQRFFFSDGPYDRGLLTRVKDASNLEGAQGTAPAGPDPDSPDGERFRKFVARYKSRFGREPSIFVENAYDSMYVAAIAMEIAKSTTPGAAIRDAMAKVSSPGGKKVPVGDWATIRSAIRAGEAIDFEGASGNVDFDPNGDLKPPYTYVVWKIENGQLVVSKRVPVP